MINKENVSYKIIYLHHSEWQIKPTLLGPLWTQIEHRTSGSHKLWNTRQSTRNTINTLTKKHLLSIK
jgi:hypothetical protein